MADQTYSEHVREIEDGMGLEDYAFKSGKARCFLDGTDVERSYEDKWNTPEGRERYRFRTPLMVERDRILYSREMRRMTEKYHVLFQGPDRILRSYTTQTLRTAHVARTVSAALYLNTHFAEGLALGAKLGAVPFVHRAKHTADDFLKKKVQAADRGVKPPTVKSKLKTVQETLFPDGNGIVLPQWIEEIGDTGVAGSVAEYVPFAAGQPEEAAYSSGKESYWLLTTDPYLRRPRRQTFLPQTMYGIWRHSRGMVARPEGFQHKSKVWDHPDYTGITWDHATHEASVVQFADDITWIIENVSDADAAVVLGGREHEIYARLATFLRKRDVQPRVTSSVSAKDPGGLYTYFISDLIDTSRKRLEECAEHAPSAARDGEALVSLSNDGGEALSAIQEFLEKVVFKETRVNNRNHMVDAIARACLEILCTSDSEILKPFLDRQGQMEDWEDEERALADELLDNPIHRAQLAVDILASMSDQEVYDFAGFGSI
jgi:dGTP triphosphohydrolase